VIIQPPKISELKFAGSKSPRLRVVTYSLYTNKVTLNGFTHSGLINDSWNLDGLGSAQSRFIPLTEIPLAFQLSTAVSAVYVGKIYAQVFLQFEGVDCTLLTTGYISTGQPVCYPGVNLHSSVDDPGGRQTYEGTPPAAGANWNEPIAYRNLWVVHNVRLTLTTDANAANRLVHLTILDGNDQIVAFTVASAVQTAGTTKQYTFAPYVTIPTAFSDYIAGHLPIIIMTSGMYILTSIDNIQAGDQIDPCGLEIQRFVNP
jgi:hypothetical protein